MACARFPFHLSDVIVLLKGVRILDGVITIVLVMNIPFRLAER